MIRAYAVLAVAFLVVVVGCEKPRKGRPPPPPSRLIELTLYDVSGLKGLEITDEELGAITDYHVPVKTTKMIFLHTRHKNGLSLWQGSCLGVAATEDGTRYRLAVSYSGGFFKILGHEGYFQTLGPSRQELDSLIRRVAIQVFIPARKAALTQPATRNEIPAGTPDE